MTPWKRIVLAAVMAVLVVAVFAGVAMFLGGHTREPTGAVSIAQASHVEAPKVEHSLAPPAVDARRNAAVTATALPAPPVELPIEEVLAESGEDPGAVYYMSRVREALHEGNPTFARELLRQFKEEHPNSVLIEEATALFASGR